MKNSKIVAIVLLLPLFFIAGCKDDDEKPVPKPPIPGSKTVPKIYVNTENGAVIDSKENYTNATFFLNGDSTVWETMAERSFRIRGRGNSTWTWPKKPYRLNFPEETSLFNMTPKKNWAILADFLDQSHMSNAAAFELGRRLGIPFANNYFAAELYINNELKGLYGLTEHIKDNVVLQDGDILMEADVNYDEVNKFPTDMVGLPVQIQGPETAEAATKAKAIWDKVEQVLFGTSYETRPAVLDSNGGWRDLFDTESLMKYFLVCEMASNPNILAHPNSFWMRYEASTGKIHFGPLWDFDWQWTNNWNSPTGNTGLYFAERSLSSIGGLAQTVSSAKIVFRFFDDPKFVREYKKFINETIASGKLDMSSFIDSLGAAIKPAVERDYQIWKEHYIDNFNFDVQISWFKDYNQTRIRRVREYANTK